MASYIKNSGCICGLLNHPEIYIDKNIFHENICTIHYKYLKNSTNSNNPKNDIELYNNTQRDFFVDLVEYNIFKYKIRDATIYFLVEYLNNYLK